MKQGTAAYAKHEQLVAEARAYKAAGHSHKEVAEKFGKSEQWSQTWCKGIASQERNPKYLRNQYTSGEFDRIENLKRVLAERAPNFEYVRGFKDMDSKVIVRCKTCGSEIEKSMVGLRQKHKSVCDICEKEKRKSIKAQGKMRYAALLFNAGEQQTWKFCGCGALIPSNKRACAECVKRRSNRYHNEKKERRRVKSFTKESSQISVQTLYERDRGVCWICGKPCRLDVDYNDNHYPSIDHLIPISKGGKDEWGNVKLAHRICNSVRGARIYTAP